MFLVYVVFGLPDDTIISAPVVFGATAAGIGVAGLIAWRATSSVGSAAATSALKPPTSAGQIIRRPATRFYARRSYYNRPTRKYRLPKQ